MAGFRHIVTAFLAGEYSPLLGGRVDSDQLKFGLETCENWLPIAEGPLVKRPGFGKVCDAAPTAGWLTAFRRSAANEYAVEWSDLKARFFTNGARIETSPGVAYEITTPYTAAEAPALSMQQSFDRQYIDHADHAPSALRRDSATTFAIETTTLKNGPFADGNSDESITLTASGTTGAITLTASSAIFTAGHVGALFRVQAKDFSDVKAWEPQMDGVTAGDKVRNEGKVYQAATSGKTGTVQPTHTEGSEWDGQNLNDVLNAKGPYGVKWTYLHDQFGIVEITAQGGTTATCDVKRRLPDSVTSVATWRWAHQAFSAAAGWPSHCALYKGRMVHVKDQEIVGTVVGDYGGGSANFAAFTDTGTLAADLSFRRTIPLEDGPQWLARSGSKLLLGTSTREIAIGPINNSEAFSGTNIDAEDQSFYGGEPVVPVQAGTETIFVEAGGRRLRSADYDFSRDRYDALDLTAAAEHITKGGIIQLVHQRSPRSILHGVRADGQIVSHTRTRLDLKGLARVKLGGGARALSAVAINGVDNQTSELWALVERENGAGTTVREIWQQQAWRELGDDQEEQFFVDGGIRIEAAAGQTHFTGLTWLASQAVAVLAAGGVVPNMTVAADGSLDLPAKSVPADRAFIVIVGLAYTATATKVGPALDVSGKQLTGVLQKVRKLALRVLDTVGLRIAAPGENPHEIIDRSASDAMDAPIPLRSGDYGDNLDSDFDTTGRCTWISSDPTAAVITAAMLNMEMDTADV